MATDWASPARPSRPRSVGMGMAPEGEEGEATSSLQRPHVPGFRSLQEPSSQALAHPQVPQFFPPHSFTPALQTEGENPVM